MAGDFRFEIPLIKAYRSEEGDMMVEGVAASTTLDRQRERMSTGALLKMIHYQGIDLLPSHTAGPLDVLGIVQDIWVDDKQCKVIAKLDAGHPPAARLFDRLEKGATYGLSVGGKVTKAHWDLEEGTRSVRVIDDVELDHVALCRPSVAANPDTYLSVLQKTVEDVIPQEESQMSEAVELSEDTQKGLAQRLGDAITGTLGNVLRKADDDDKASTNEDYVTQEQFRELMAPVEAGMAEINEKLAELAPSADSGQAEKGVELTAEQLEQLEAEGEGEEPDEDAEAEPEPAVIAAEPALSASSGQGAALKHEIAETIAGSNLPEHEKVRLAKAFVGDIDRLHKSIEALSEQLDEHNRTQHAGTSAALESEALESEALEKSGPAVEWGSILT